MHKKNQQPSLTVRSVAGLRNYLPGCRQIPVQETMTIAEIISLLGLDRELVGVAMADGRFVDLDSPIHRAGELLLLPRLGGG